MVSPDKVRITYNSPQTASRYRIEPQRRVDQRGLASTANELETINRTTWLIGREEGPRAFNLFRQDGVGELLVAEILAGGGGYPTTILPMNSEKSEAQLLRSDNKPVVIENGVSAQLVGLDDGPKNSSRFR